MWLKMEGAGPQTSFPGDIPPFAGLFWPSSKAKSLEELVEVGLRLGKAPFRLRVRLNKAAGR